VSQPLLQTYRERVQAAKAAIPPGSQTPPVTETTFTYEGGGMGSTGFSYVFNGVLQGVKRGETTRDFGAALAVNGLGNAKLHLLCTSRLASADIAALLCVEPLDEKILPFYIRNEQLYFITAARPVQKSDVPEFGEATERLSAFAARCGVALPQASDEASEATVHEQVAVIRCFNALKAPGDRVAVIGNALLNILREVGESAFEQAVSAIDVL
jgi:hypothetical protein